MVNIKKALLFLSCLMISACATVDEGNITSSASAKTACQDPRPEMCTREYNPVCATYKNDSKKTAATGCTACSDSEVTGYIAGACEIIKSD